MQDAREELDPDFPVDADILAAGVRSAIWQPFSSREGFHGGVWLASDRPHAVRDEHQETLVGEATLPGLA